MAHRGPRSRLWPPVTAAGGDGWSVVLIAIAIVAGSKIAERVADYLLPKGRHWRAGPFSTATTNDLPDTDEDTPPMSDDEARDAASTRDDGGNPT